MRTTALLLCTLLAGAASAGPEIIENPATPAHGVQPLAREEMWRAGGAGDEEAEPMEINCFRIAG